MVAEEAWPAFALAPEAQGEGRASKRELARVWRREVVPSMRRRSTRVLMEERVQVLGARDAAESGLLLL